MKAEFLLSVAYNRTMGKYILNWDSDNITLFGFVFIRQQTLAEKYPIEKYDIVDEKFRERLRENDYFWNWPRPALRDGTYSQQQKDKYGIRLIFKDIYVHRHTIYPSF
jgi:hypothetical protein